MANKFAMVRKPIIESPNTANYWKQNATHARNNLPMCRRSDEIAHLCENYADALLRQSTEGDGIPLSNVADRAEIKRLRLALLSVHALTFRNENAAGIRDIAEEALTSCGGV